MQTNEFARSKSLFGAEALILAKKIISMWMGKEYMEGKDWELKGKRGRNLLHLLCVGYAYLGNRKKALEVMDTVLHFGLKVPADAMVAVELAARGVPYLEEKCHGAWWEVANRYASDPDAWLTRLVIGRVAKKLADKFGKKVVTGEQA